MEATICPSLSLQEVLNTERAAWSLIVLVGGGQRSEVRDSRSEEVKTQRERESEGSAAELMVDSWSSE